MRAALAKGNEGVGYVVTIVDRSQHKKDSHGQILARTDFRTRSDAIVAFGTESARWTVWLRRSFVKLKQKCIFDYDFQRSLLFNVRLITQRSEKMSFGQLFSSSIT